MAPAMLLVALAVAKGGSGDASTNATAASALEVAKDMILGADTNGDGKLHLKDFENAVIQARIAVEGASQVQRDEECMCHVGNAFRLLDTNEDESVDVVELKELLEHLAALEGQDPPTSPPEEHAVRELSAGANAHAGIPVLNAGVKAERKFDDDDEVVRSSSGGGELGHDRNNWGDQGDGSFILPGGPGSIIGGGRDHSITVHGPYRQWMGPILRPRYEGQTKEERWFEVWGVRNGIPGPRMANAPHNKPVPSWYENRAKFRQCIELPNAPPDPPPLPRPPPSPPPSLPPANPPALPVACQLIGVNTTSSNQVCINCCETVGQPHPSRNGQEGVMINLVIQFEHSHPLFSNLGGAGPYSSDWGAWYWYRAFEAPGDIGATCNCNSASYPATARTRYPWMTNLESQNQCAMYGLNNQPSSSTAPGARFGGVAFDWPEPAHNCPENSESQGGTVCCSVVDPAVVEYPDQPPILRFSNVGSMMGLRIDYFIQEETPGQYLAQYDANPIDTIFVRKGLTNNVAKAGGIVAFNLPAPGEVTVQLGIRASCCSRVTCRECQYNITNEACLYWLDGAPGCDPACLPQDPVLGTVNSFCCCFGVDTFPLEYMDFCNNEESPLFSPRIDGGFRDRYLEHRAIPGFENTTQQSCDSTHVRLINRWVQFRYEVQETLNICNDQSRRSQLPQNLRQWCQSGLLQDWLLKVPPTLMRDYASGEDIADWQLLTLPSMLSYTIPGFVPQGITIRNRLLDFDRGGPSLRWLEEVTIFSEAHNILFWKYPDSVETCATEYDTLNDIRTNTRNNVASLSPQGACCEARGVADAGDFNTEDFIVRYSDAFNTNSVSDSDSIFDPSDGTVTYSAAPGLPPLTVSTERQWIPDSEVHDYSCFVLEDDCCGCISTCGADGRTPCCLRYSQAPYNLFVSGDVVDNSCTRRCTLYDQYNSSMRVPFLEGFGAYYVDPEDIQSIAPVQSYGNQPINLYEAHNMACPTGAGSWSLRFRANSQGGSANNPQIATDPDNIVAPFGANDNLIMNPLTGNPQGVENGDAVNAGRCQVAIRTIDVTYAITAPTAEGITMYFRMSSCDPLTNAERDAGDRNSCEGYPNGGGSADAGRNVLFASDSTSPVCIPSDCTLRATCRRHSDCPMNDGLPSFCAKRCISGDCPLVGESFIRFLGREDLPGRSGYGVCQDCWDCVYDSEVYPDETISEGLNTCANLCAVISQDDSGGYAPYGMCPGCMKVRTLFENYIDGTIASGSYIPVAANVEPTYTKCASSSDCGAGMYCDVQCSTAVASAVAKPGLLSQCNAFEGVPRSQGGWGFCQPCSNGCQSFMYIRDNYDDQGNFTHTDLNSVTTCPDVCGLACPRCVMDNLCAGNVVSSARGNSDGLSARGYDLALNEYWKVGDGLPETDGYVTVGMGYCDANGPFRDGSGRVSAFQIGGTAQERGAAYTLAEAQSQCDSEPSCTHIVRFQSNTNQYGVRNWWMYGFPRGQPPLVTADPTITNDANQPLCYQKADHMLTQLGSHSATLGPFAENGCWEQDASLAPQIFTELVANFELPNGLNVPDIDCPCLAALPQHVVSQYVSNGFLHVETNSQTYNYPTDYGVGCEAHDQSMDPWCSGANPASWCSMSWCWVDRNNCNVQTAISSYLPDANNAPNELFYSYSACM